MPIALIAGASRGISLGLARQYAADGWRVIGTCRDAKGEATLRALGAELRRLDVSDPCQFESLRTDMGDPGATIDVTTSVDGMRRVIAAAQMKDNGRFLDYTGVEIPW